MSLTLHHPAGGVLTITDAVLETMWGFVQRRWRDREAGGMLIGHHPLDSEDIILDRLTTPQPEDRRSRCRFHRDKAAHQQLLDLQWILSGSKRTYLGEWHTHPEDDPQPSGLDLNSWWAAVKDTGFHGPGLLFMIVGRRTTRLWFGTKGQGTFPLLLEHPTGERYGSSQKSVPHRAARPAIHRQSRRRETGES